MGGGIAPPEPSTEATANCAEPANVVSDMRIGGTMPIPASRARMPNEAPNAATASASGAAARMPATISARGWRNSLVSGIMELASMMMEYSTGMDDLSSEMDSVGTF